MPASQLSLQNVTRRHDDHVVLDDVSLSIKPGERAGIIGDNGAVDVLPGLKSRDSGLGRLTLPVASCFNALCRDF
ncbi:hypothetical protein ACFU93_45765, partial [Streptomyces sp. NPDC057611]